MKIKDDIIKWREQIRQLNEKISTHKGSTTMLKN